MADSYRLLLILTGSFHAALGGDEVALSPPSCSPWLRGPHACVRRRSAGSLRPAPNGVPPIIGPPIPSARSHNFAFPAGCRNRSSVGVDDPHVTNLRRRWRLYSVSTREWRVWFLPFLTSPPLPTCRRSVFVKRTNRNWKQALR